MVGPVVGLIEVDVRIQGKAGLLVAVLVATIELDVERAVADLEAFELGQQRGLRFPIGDFDIDESEALDALPGEVDDVHGPVGQSILEVLDSGRLRNPADEEADGLQRVAWMQLFRPVELVPEVVGFDRQLLIAAVGF